MEVIAMKRLSLLGVFVFLTKFVSGLVCVDETLDCKDPVSSIFKIGKDSCACDSHKHAGALKFVDGQLVVCLGNRWAKAQWKAKVDAYGTEFKPGLSCKNIKEELKGSPEDGIYWIRLPSADKGFPVYCDMKNGGWTLVHKYVSGMLAVDAFRIFHANLPHAEFVEEAIRLTTDYRNHYKNRLGILDHWKRFAKVKLALYSSRGRPLLKPLIFKLPKLTSSQEYLLKENLEQSPWDDLIKTEAPRAFMSYFDCWGRPDYCRLFEVMKVYGDNPDDNSKPRCDGDIGWLMMSSRSYDICPYEKGPGRKRVFLYSKGKAAVRFNDDNAVGVADFMAIFMQ
ncbi:uncharacterized protein [Acropora muricata]|uniref:uncharacterized protein n=1 Tax=Acropora muricata TaxID=159855 RepID=UPI0034E3959A